MFALFYLRFGAIGLRQRENEIGALVEGNGGEIVGKREANQDFFRKSFISKQRCPTVSLGSPVTSISARSSSPRR